MKKILEKFSFKNSVKLIICIVTFSACVGCSDTFGINQEVNYKRFSNDTYSVDTYVWLNDSFGSYDKLMHLQSQECSIMKLDSIKTAQLIRAKQIQSKLELSVKH